MDERIRETEDIAARQKADALSNEIIGAAIEVHRYLDQVYLSRLMKNASATNLD